MTQESDKALDALLTYEYLVKNFGDRIPCYKEPTGCCASDDINGGDGCADGCEMLKCFKAGYKLAGEEITSLRAEVSHLTAELEAAREALLPVLVSLVAAVSLLERSPKTVAPSNKMFDQMLSDYKGTIDEGRKYLAAHTVENKS